MKYITLLIGLGLLFANCSKKTIYPIGQFQATKAPSAPDYSNAFYWAALPTKADMADATPKGIKDEQANAAVDVFFMYPTIYTGEKGDNQWNAPVNDPAFNKRVDESTIQLQASVFNGAGKIYAPRYRQAHISAYFADDKAMAKEIFDLAYEDLKKAFQYYLDNYNQGRPIIIASHSQGTTHGIRLVKEFFDGTPLQQQLVAAYLVGIPVDKTAYENIPVCETPTQTGCFCTWRTFEEGYTPRSYTSDKIAVTNPLTWTVAEDLAPHSLNKGGILRKIKKIHPNLTSAKVVAKDGILWAEKPKFFGSFLLKTKNYHVADFNFYYLNVRENAQDRVKAYLGSK